MWIKLNYLIINTKIEALIDNLLDLKNKGKNIIISTHDINFASSLSDYVYMIKKGELYNHGITSKVLNNKNIIECYELEKFGNLDFIIS